GAERTMVDRGTLGDSVGRRLGFRWRPTAAAIKQAGTVKFSVSSLNQASENLIANLTIVLPDNPSYMRVSLVGTSPATTAASLNEWLTQFVDVAGELKKRKVAQLTSILATQVNIANNRKTQAEQALESF